MREKVAEYLKKPTAKLYAELTSEEQRYVDGLKAADKKADKPKTS